MKYSSPFGGWLGDIAEDATYRAVENITERLLSYYEGRGHAGQKIAIGYDPRYFAKRFAQYAAVLCAKRGIKVFFADKPTPSSVLLASSLHKTCLGTLVLTGDEHGAEAIGIRAYNQHGYILHEQDLPENTVTEHEKPSVEHYNTWSKKGYIEHFDPMIVYQKVVADSFDFSGALPFSKRILCNPLYGSSIDYFDRLLHEQGLLGYTYKMQREQITDFSGITPSPSLYLDDLHTHMIDRGAEIGIILSPDASSFQVLLGEKVLTPQDMLFLLMRLNPFTQQNCHVLVSDLLGVSDTEHTHLTVVKEADFLQHLERTQPALAVDGFGRFYFSGHGAADALFACFYLIQACHTPSLEAEIQQLKEMV